jgi:hypothetical protein
MQDELPFDSYLEDYYQGNLQKKELEGRIFKYILDNSHRFHLRRWERDECIDFLCWFYPRLSRAIDRYVYTGASFDAYIGSMIRWSAKEYMIIERDHRVIEDSCWDLHAAEMEVQSPEGEYLESPPKPFKRVSNPRQALVLLLKSYHYVSEDFIARAAPAIGVPKETLICMIDTLRQRRLDRDEELRGLQERIQSQYYRCVTFERRIAISSPGSARLIKLTKRLEKARRRLAVMRSRLRLIRAEASNRQVAEVLGVPKGTIDSNLYAVKSRYKGKYDEGSAALVSQNYGPIGQRASSPDARRLRARPECGPGAAATLPARPLASTGG